MSDRVLRDDSGDTEPGRLGVQARALAMGKAAARKAFKVDAGRLAAQLVDEPAVFASARMTKLAEWFCDQDSLVLVTGPHEDADTADEVLAYGLAWQGDRDLVLVVPETLLGAIPGRLAWIGTPVRLFRYGGDLLLRPVVIPARSEVWSSPALMEALRFGIPDSLGNPVAFCCSLPRHPPEYSPARWCRGAGAAARWPGRAVPCP